MAGASGNVRAGRAFVEIMLDQNKLEEGLKTAKKKLNNFGSALTSIGKGMVGVSALAATPLAFAAKTFADFDDEMRMVKAVTNSTETEFKHLTETAEKLGRETSFTAKQVAEGMTAMGRMGFNSKEIDSSILAVLNLSRATGTELGNAAEIAANNMRVFGLETSKMGEVSDILTATANGSAQTLTDLAEGLKMAGPQAAAAKDNIINVSGALGVLANMGIKGSLAGTALRKSYSQFANTKIQEKLKGIGISTIDTNGNLRAMPEIMADIAKQINAMPTAQRLSFAEEIFDLRGSLAGLQLGGNIQQLEEFIKKLKSVDGTAKETATQMDGGIGGAFRRLMSAVEGVQISIGRVIGEALAPYMDKLSLTLNSVAQWCAAHKELIITAVKIIGGIAALGAALLVTGVALKAMAVAAGTLSAMFTVLKMTVLAPVAAVHGLTAAFALLKTVMIGIKVAALTAWGAIATPAVLATAAIGALAAIVWKLSGAWDICLNTMRNLGMDFSNVFSGIKEVVGETWEIIKTALSLGDIAGAVKVGLSALNVVWLSGMLPLKKVWIELKNFFSDTWTITVYSILKLANNLWYGLLMGIKQIGDAITDAWGYIWDGIIGVFETTVATLKKDWIKFKGSFDWTIDVKAETAKIDEELARSREQRRDKSASNVNRRAKERQALNEKWESSNKDIDKRKNLAIGKNRDDYSKAMNAAAAEIAAAKKQLQSAMDEVKSRAATKNGELKNIEKKVAKAQQGTQAARVQVESVAKKSIGAWSVQELSGMLNLGGSAQERTAKATELIAANTRESNKLIKNLNATSQTGTTYI